MKKEYAIYGRGISTEGLKRNLTKKELEVLENYRKYLSMTSGEKKIRQVFGFLYQFRDMLEKSMLSASKEDLEEFFGLVNASKYEYNTKVMIKKFVKRFVKWHYKDLNLLENLKAGEFKPNRKKINKTVLLSPEEIKTMLHKAENLRDKALLILLYESGARPQEIVELKWKDILFDTDEVHLDSNKTKISRDIPIKESTIHLRRWQQEYSYSDVKQIDFVFPSQQRDKSISVERLEGIIREIANRSGITRNITPYTFRHSRLTDIYKLGVKGLEHNKFAGHKAGSKQQATYSHIDNEDMKEDVLTKVFHIKELTPTERDEMKKMKQEMEKEVDLQKRINQLLCKKMINQISEKEFKKELGNLLTLQIKHVPGEQRQIIEII